MERTITASQGAGLRPRSKRRPHTIPCVKGKGWTLYHADALEGLRALPEGSVHCVVTSPPYWGLRDYGVPPTIWGGDCACKHRWAKHVQPAANGAVHSDGMSGKTLSSKSVTRNPKHSAFCQRCDAWRGALGLEPTPELYVAHLADVFREVKRVLRDDGTAWLILGDSYTGSWGNYASNGAGRQRPKRTEERRPIDRQLASPTQTSSPKIWQAFPGVSLSRCKPKVGSCAATWSGASRTPCPKSVRDRPTRAHEYVFLLAKSRRYFYDIDAVRHPFTEGTQRWIDKTTFEHQRGGAKNHVNANRSPHRVVVSLRQRMMCPQLEDRVPQQSGRNLRSVWTIATQPFPGTHFATFPEQLVEPCILAGTSTKGCCAKCGAPYTRVVRKKRYPTRPGRTHKVDSTGLANRDPQRHCTDTATVGWKRGCTCKAAKAVPCVVLDPFAGTSTTSIVALRYSLHYAGIELSREYSQLSQQRLQVTGTVRASMRSPKKQESRRAV